MVGPDNAPGGAEVVSRQLVDFIRTLNGTERRRLPGERQLAKQFHCSRNTVREALAGLAAKDIVEIRQRSGIFPKHQAAAALAVVPDPIDAAQAFSALCVVAGALAGSAASNRSEQDIARLQVITADLGRALLERDTTALRGCVGVFYLDLARIGGNSYLLRLMEDIAASFRNAAGKYAIAESESEQFFAEHVNLIQALSLGNEIDARQSAQRCLGLFGDTMEQG